MVNLIDFADNLHAMDTFLSPLPGPAQQGDPMGALDVWAVRGAGTTSAR